MSRTVDLRTDTAEDTKAVGAALASVLEPGDVVSLTGELGAGKTCLVQGAAAALGIEERVTSPSFVLRRDYEGTVPVTHLDVYRLETLQEVLDLGYGESSSVVFVEWGDAVRPLLPSEHLEVELRLADPVGRGDDGAPAATAAADVGGDGGGGGAGAGGGGGAGNGGAEAAHRDAGDRGAEAAADDTSEARQVRLRAHGDAWKRRLPTLEDALGQWQGG